MNEEFTKAQYRAYVDRWRVVNEYERAEMRDTPVLQKLKQLASLMASAGLFRATEDPKRTPKRGHGGTSFAKRIVAERESLAPLLSALRDSVVWLASEEVKGAVIGGVAVSLLARPTS